MRDKEIILIYIQKWFEKISYMRAKIEIPNFQLLINKLLNFIMQESYTIKIKDYLKDLLKNILTIFAQQINNEDVAKYFMIILKDMTGEIQKDCIEENLNFNKVSSMLIIFDSILVCFPKFIYNDYNYNSFIEFVSFVFKNISKIKEDTEVKNIPNKYKYH